MTTASAIKKLEKAGMTVKQDGTLFTARNASKYIISFFRNGGSDSITCINVRAFDDHHDSQSDYCAGVWANNISQAIRLAN